MRRIIDGPWPSVDAMLNFIVKTNPPKPVLFLIVLLFPVLALLVLLGMVMAFNAGLFHDQIEARLLSALGPDSQVHLGRMNLAYRWPLRLRVAQSVIDLQQVHLQWQNLELDILQVTSLYSLSATFTQPRVIIKPPPALTAPTAQSTERRGSGGAQSLPALKVKLRTIDGEIKAADGALSQLNFTFEQKLLMKSPASLHLSGLMGWRALSLGIPLQIDTDKLTLSEDVVKTSDLKAALGGIDADLQGTSLLSEGRHRWLLEVRAKNLAELPQPPMANLPAKNWRGELYLKAEVTKESLARPWSAEGTFLAKKVGADLDYQQDLLRVRGPFSMEADGKFAYVKDRFGLPHIKAALDLSEAQVSNGELLNKGAGQAMKIALSGGGDEEKLNLEELLFDFWNFSGKVSGDVVLKSPFLANLDLNLKPARLDGVEQLFPPLKASPVQGEIALAGSVHGPLAEYAKARFVVDTFALKKFSGVIHWEREGLVKMRGPVAADLQGKGEFAKGAVQSFAGRGDADFSQTAFVAGPLVKAERAPFRLRFDVRNVAQSVQIEEMSLDSFLGNLAAKGKIDLGPQTKLSLNVKARPLSLSELRIAMPIHRDSVPKGQLSANVNVSGELQLAKPWFDWPVQLGGAVELKILEYKMLSTTPGAAASTAPAPPVASGPTSFLPDGELTRRARVNIKAQVDQFVKDRLVAKDVAVEGLYANGKFTGTAGVAQVFGGAVQLKNLDVPLLELKPKLRGSVAWQNLVIEEALAFAKPEYKTFASGRTAGLADFTTVMPAQNDFMAQLKLRGELNAQPVVLNSVKIGELVNAQINKLPQLKLKPMKVDPLRGQAKARFELNQGVVDVASFQGVDVDNSEIQMKGKVALATMEGDFAGTFFWHDPPVKGCVLEGNADPGGRLIVPLAIKGNMMKPGLSLLSDVMGKLASKAIECEGKKLIEKVKTESKQKLESELKKTLKNLLGN